MKGSCVRSHSQCDAVKADEYTVSRNKSQELRYPLFSFKNLVNGHMKAEEKTGGCTAAKDSFPGDK